MDGKEIIQNLSNFGVVDALYYLLENRTISFYREFY